jgi:hypothetical protein
MNSLNRGVETIYKKNDKKLFKLKGEEIVRSSSVCQNDVEKSFVTESVKTADALVIAYDVYKTGVRGSIRGFACVQFKTYPDWVYLDLICRGSTTRMNYRGKPSAAPGRALIENIKEIARTMKRKGIVLSAIDSVIGYYKRLDFQVAAADLTCDRRRTQPRKARNITLTKDFYKNGSRLYEGENKKLKANNYGTLMQWCI